MKEIHPAFRDTSFIASLQYLLQVGFIQEALYQLLWPEEYGRLLVVNHQDRYLSLSNESYYFILLTSVTPALQAEVSGDLSYIQQRRKTIVHLQQQTDLTALPHYHRVSLAQLRQQAEKNGIPAKNVFLLLLEQLFEDQPAIESFRRTQKE